MKTPRRVNNSVKPCGGGATGVDFVESWADRSEKSVLVLGKPFSFHSG
jgi:hypothetical protein